MILGKMFDFLLCNVVEIFSALTQAVKEYFHIWRPPYKAESPLSSMSV